MRDIFAWLEGLLESMLDVHPQSEAKTLEENVVKVCLGRNINAADKHDECNHAEPLMHDHAEKKRNEIRLKKAEFSSSMKKRFQIATDMSNLRQTSALIPDVFKFKLQKKLYTYAQADITVKRASQDLGRLEHNHLHACLCDTEIAMFKRGPISESSLQGFEPTLRFPNFP